MSAKLKLVTYVLLFITLTGCISEKESITYFGGKIINPKDNCVILYEKEAIVDTFYLDDKNKFLGKLHNISGSLFVFKHGPEHQYLYLEPEDSVLIRLNTWDFDESLVFSGKGAKRNNVLIDCFLDAEKDDTSFYNLYNLSPARFKNKVSLLEKQKKARLKELLSRFENESQEYKKLLEISLTYPVYRRLENYQLAHKRANRDLINEKIDETFFAHRKFIDFEKDTIMYYSAYRDYIVSYLYNTVSSAGHKLYSDEFTTELLHTIDNHFHSEENRNTLLRQTIISHFYRKSSCDFNTNAFETFLKLTSNNEDVALIKRLINDTKKINKGKKLLNFKITDLNGSNHSINQVIKGNDAVLYFWNSKYVTKEYLYSKVNYLSRNHPNIKFIGIRIDGPHKDHIKKLDIKSQYYISQNSVANEFLTSKLPRTLLINEKGIVVNAYASLSSQNIYNQIANLAKN
ncbi:MAG: hypothetical protein GKR88_03415 [Flavobacteriaceae bacterium]|nr:MAG: hypothetical protein GKR88_03415 [Flavobacteriaceae bacterium]